MAFFDLSLVKHLNSLFYLIVNQGDDITWLTSNWNHDIHNTIVDVSLGRIFLLFDHLLLPHYSIIHTIITPRKTNCAWGMKYTIIQIQWYCLKWFTAMNNFFNVWNDIKFLTHIHNSTYWNVRPKMVWWLVWKDLVHSKSLSPISSKFKITWEWPKLFFLLDKWQLIENITMTKRGPANSAYSQLSIDPMHREYASILLISKPIF